MYFDILLYAKLYCKLYEAHYNNSAVLMFQVLVAISISVIITLYFLLLSDRLLSFLVILQMFSSEFLAIQLLSFLGYLSTVLLDQNRVQNVYDSCHIQEISFYPLRFCYIPIQIHLTPLQIMHRLIWFFSISNHSITDYMALYNLHRTPDIIFENFSVLRIITYLL